MERCLFTNEETNTEEHVIPRWLQKRFSLSEQTLMIPNGSKLKYKHVKVPASKDANHLFGKIEDNISKGIFDLPEIYLWSLKIHIGLIYRDSSLRWDIKDKETPFILDVNNFSQEIWLFQKLYSIWAGGGKTIPSPLGSVFIIDSLIPNEFDFVHCLTTGTIGIQIGKKFILSFFWDQGDGMKSNALDHWKNHHLPMAKSHDGTTESDSYNFLAHRIWACECAYWLYRNRRSFNMVSTKTDFILVQPMTRPDPKPAEEEEFRKICRNFGLKLIRYNGVGNVYAPFQQEVEKP